MADFLTPIGEEFYQKWAWRQDLISRSNTTIEVGVYNQATDSLTEDNDLADITTEPSDGNYARQTFTMDSSDVDVKSNGEAWVLDIMDHTFDMINTTGTADHYFIAITFQSDEAGDSSATKHLISVGPLEKSYDLSSIDELTNKDAGLLQE